MQSARLIRGALLGLLVTGMSYSAGASETISEEMAVPAPAESPAASEELAVPTPAESPAAPAEAIIPVSAGPDEAATVENVSRAAVTTSIMDREPVDSVDTLSNDQNEVFFFTEILNLTGGTITHRWEYNGDIMAEVLLEIGGPRWRTYSTKRLFEGWLGEWKVSVVDESGEVLRSVMFNYVPATPAAPEQE